MGNYTQKNCLCEQCVKHIIMFDLMIIFDVSVDTLFIRLIFEQSNTLIGQTFKVCFDPFMGRIILTWSTL